jgi:DNA-binding CsgD family transcriptional regulator
MDSFEGAKKPVLTKREVEVLHLIADGNTYKAIADELGIKLFTVKNHACSIYDKLGAVSQANAVYKYFFVTKSGVLGMTLQELIDVLNGLVKKDPDAG